MSDRVELKHLEMENQKYQFRYLRNQLNEKKLYRGDPRLLMYVYFHDGRKQAEIAKGLCVKPASLTVMLQRMEQAGLVNRKSDEQDQRVQRVYITELGRETSKKTVELFQKVLAQIYASYYENPRELLLFFYYPSEEYLSCLMTEEQLLFYDEIDTRDLFGGNNEREKILIFEVI